jgi:hypothetical protein
MTMLLLLLLQLSAVVSVDWRPSVVPAHWLPLSSNFSDVANSSSSLQLPVQGDAAGCSSFVGGAWQQSCGSAPAYLQLPGAQVAGDYSACVALNFQRFNNTPASIFGLGQLSYSYPTGDLTLDGMFSVDVNLPTHTWAHVCTTYSDHGGVASLYLNGVLLIQVAGGPPAPALPVLVGGGGSPAQALFANWRVYESVLPAPLVADLAHIDTP